jgi:ABC-type dipeptide/oligopeptide/nickel transport system permease subunit
MAQEQASTARPVLTEEYFPPATKRFDIVRYIRREPAGAVGATLIIIIVFLAVAAPVMKTTDPRAFGGNILHSPSWEHPLGTDARGRDVWSRVLYGGRISLKIGVASIIIGTLGGTALALIAGTLGGAVDFVMSRAGEIMLTFPSLLFVLTIRTSIGDDFPDTRFLPRGELVLITAISVIFIPSVFRIMRGAVLEQRASPYIEAARVVGAGQLRIMFRHLAPNIAGLMIVLTTAGLPATILLESSLSFLGVGVPVGTPSWGADLSGSSRTFFIQAPWLAIAPGLALSITVFAFNIFGDSLRDVLDPRLRGKI